MLMHRSGRCARGAVGGDASIRASWIVAVIGNRAAGALARRRRTSSGHDDPNSRSPQNAESRTTAFFHGAPPFSKHILSPTNAALTSVLFGAVLPIDRHRPCAGACRRRTRFVEDSTSLPQRRWEIGGISSHMRHLEPHEERRVHHNGLIELHRARRCGLGERDRRGLSTPTSTPARERFGVRLLKKT